MRRGYESVPNDRVKGGSRVFATDEWRLIAAELDLSNRETQIVRHIFDDHKEWAIAQELGISSHTVHTYLGRLYRKLSVKSRCGLIIRVIEGYLSLSRLPKLKGRQ